MNARRSEQKEKGIASLKTPPKRVTKPNVDDPPFSPRPFQLITYMSIPCQWLLPLPVDIDYATNDSTCFQDELVRTLAQQLMNRILGQVTEQARQWWCWQRLMVIVHIHQ